MPLTTLALALVLSAAPKPRTINENFDSLPRGGCPKGWAPLRLDRGPLGIWGAGRVEHPGSWPQALIQDGRPYPSRWVGLSLPGSFLSLTARALVGGGRPGSGAAGLALSDKGGLATIYGVLAGGRGLAVFQHGKDGAWESSEFPLPKPVPGPWLIFVALDAKGQARASFGTVEKVLLRQDWSPGTISSEPGWTLSFASRTEGNWWFDDVKVTGIRVLSGDVQGK